MFSDVRRHACYQLANAPLRPYPFPHLVVPEIFPPEFYPLLRASMPADAAYVPLHATGRVSKGYNKSRLAFFPGTQPGPALDPGIAAFWNRLFAAFLEDDEFAGWLVARFYPVLERRFGIGPARPGVELDREMFLMRDLENYALGPHTDSPRKAVTVLFYLPERGDRPEIGTSFYVPKDRGFRCKGGPHHRVEDFDRVATVPFRPNTLVAFPKTDDCFHGVEPVAGPVRRDVLLFDLKVPHLADGAAAPHSFADAMA